MNNFLKAITFFLLTQSTLTQNKSVIGFWEIEKVSIGNKIMTPVAKWSKINKDGTYQSGNGWLQSVEGYWTFDKKKNIFSANDLLGIKDEYGGFKVSFENNKMFWEREEDGMHLKVSLIKVKKLPMAPSDYLEGVWDLTDITKNKKSILHTFDPNNKRKLFFRWDRIIVFYNSNGKLYTGYWHIHGHRSEVTLLPHNKKKKLESWKISVNEKQLIMTGISDSNKSIVRKYRRQNTL